METPSREGKENGSAQCDTYTPGYVLSKLQSYKLRILGDMINLFWGKTQKTCGSGQMGCTGVHYEGVRFLQFSDNNLIRTKQISWQQFSGLKIHILIVIKTSFLFFIVRIWDLNNPVWWFISMFTMPFIVQYNMPVHPMLHACVTYLNNAI